MNNETPLKRIVFFLTLAQKNKIIIIGTKLTILIHYIITQNSQMILWYTKIYKTSIKCIGKKSLHNKLA